MLSGPSWSFSTLKQVHTHGDHVIALPPRLCPSGPFGDPRSRPQVPQRTSRHLLAPSHHPTNPRGSGLRCLKRPLPPLAPRGAFLGTLHKQPHGNKKSAVEPTLFFFLRSADAWLVLGALQLQTQATERNKNRDRSYKTCFVALRLLGVCFSRVSDRTARNHRTHTRTTQQEATPCVD